MLDIPMTLDGSDGDNSLCPFEKFPRGRAPTWQACFGAKTHSKSTLQASRAALLDGECLSQSNHQHPRQGAGAASANRGSSVRTSIACRHVAMCVGAWSSGMVRASGARGRGFDSRSSPSHVAHVAARAAGQSRDARNSQRRPSRCSTSASRTRRPRRAASTTAGRSRRTARSSSAGRRTSTARPRATTSRASPSPARSARPSRRATSRSTTST